MRNLVTIDCSGSWQKAATPAEPRVGAACGVANAALPLSGPCPGRLRRRRSPTKPLDTDVPRWVGKGVKSLSKTPKIIPISDLRQNASYVVKDISASKQPVFIAQRERAAAVMVSMQAYEESQHELDILRLLARGEKEIEAGTGYDLDGVLKEADRLLDTPNQLIHRTAYNRR
jgi:PHD/YefM family antitoxin component YafN of YafNO toxin-antitoxin module